MRLGYDVTLAATGHSSYCGQAAALIDKWNARLAKAGVEVRPTVEISL